MKPCIRFPRCEGHTTHRDGLCRECAEGIADEMQTRRSLSRPAPRVRYLPPLFDPWGSEARGAA